MAEDPVTGYWFFNSPASSHQANPVVMVYGPGETWEEERPGLPDISTHGHALYLAVHPVTRTPKSSEEIERPSIL